MLEKIDNLVASTSRRYIYTDSDGEEFGVMIELAGFDNGECDVTAYVGEKRFPSVWHWVSGYGLGKKIKNIEQFKEEVFNDLEEYGPYYYIEHMYEEQYDDEEEEEQ